MEASNNTHIEIGLNAAILTIKDDIPLVLVIRSSDRKSDNLPYGPFSPYYHRTLEIGLRSWTQQQTGLSLGYVEQLYTFGDRGRHAQPGDTSPHVVSIGYLALTKQSEVPVQDDALWQKWYYYFPWEDWRNGKPQILTKEIEPRLLEWVEKEDARKHPLRREERIRINFGIGENKWDEEKVLERYELLYEAGIVSEAIRDGRAIDSGFTPLNDYPMAHDHRRILATAIGRLRSKIKYRPVIFELMPSNFTLFELQKTFEAISGNHIHKQNFRRLVENSGLVEQTGKVSQQTGGRPAKLFRFRRDVILERPSPGVKINKSKL